MPKFENSIENPKKLQELLKENQSKYSDELEYKYYPLAFPDGCS